MMTAVEPPVWIGSGQKWLQRCSNEAFSAWLGTNLGKLWKKKRYSKSAVKLGQGYSPYNFGFSLPSWHHDAIKALGENDEETFKAIRLMWGPGGYGWGRK